jgi:hypothetical protein
MGKVVPDYMYNKVLPQLVRIDGQGRQVELNVEHNFIVLYY